MSANTRRQYNTLSELPAELKRPVFRDPHTMDPRTWFRDLTPYFLYVLFIATLGPLLFGFHLVGVTLVFAHVSADNRRLN